MWLDVSSTYRGTCTEQMHTVQVINSAAFVAHINMVVAGATGHRGL